MKIAVIGTGYVGLPTGVGFAELGHDVTCIDKDVSKIERFNAGDVTLYEDGLEELFLKNVKAGRLVFTTAMQKAVSEADLVIIAVGTPPHPVTKEADMKFIYAAANELAEYLQGYTVIANKSTVPVGTGDDIENLITERNAAADFDVVSLPEFLREGFAVYDFFNPDRIVVGTDSARAQSLITELYKPFLDKAELLVVSRKSSETIKYASNAFLAIKIHYINEMANFCEKLGANVHEVAKGMGLDKRIGNRFLNAGPGYGGSCFPKDTSALAYMAKQNGLMLSLVETAIQGNAQRKKDMAQKIVSALKGINAPKVAVLGLTFKEGTDDCRESPAIQIVEELLEAGVSIKAYDPKGMQNAEKLLGEHIVYAADACEAANDADALVVLTEWDEFKSINLLEIKAVMQGNLLVDLRNMLKPDDALNAGFIYVGVGH